MNGKEYALKDLSVFFPIILLYISYIKTLEIKKKTHKVSWLTIATDDIELHCGCFHISL